ncbi:MAG: NAD(P)/FAD-dependent oxidoreductase [Saprospiraceae bacterium]|nr:NAD(P)/FAD-dependent oxidoreductase [Saprospiraceae bacterium]MCB9322637.1 NAD(P)/FAD-dependent oxidoreductase [Lewinellaceae bacterium]
MTEIIPPSIYSVAILGGGPAGSACAINLCRLGVKDIIILESGEYEKFRIGESIPPETRNLFQQMGILPAFLQEKHDPCFGSVSYWGDERRGYNDYILSPYGHGWHLDRRRFNLFLAKEAQSAGATVLTGAKFLTSKVLNDDTFELSYSDSQNQLDQFKARIVVDATGSTALFAHQQGSKKMETASLLCLASRFAATDTPPVFKLTHLEAVEYGWWYTARLPDKNLLVTLYSDQDTIRQKKLNRADQWMEHLKNTPNTFKLVSGMSLQDSSPKGFHAPSYRLDRIAGKNWVALGDAASAYDPITSQGIIKSLSNAWEVAPIIAKNLLSPNGGFEDFEQSMDERFRQYLEMRQHYYRLENRWPDSAFWQKFHQLNTTATL